VQGEVHAVFAYDPMADSYPHGPTPNWKYRGQGDAEAEVAAVDTKGVSVTLTLVGDDPIEALSSIGADDDAAVIAVGTKGGVTSLHGLVLGRIAAHLPDRAGRPVAIVHEATTAPQAERGNGGQAATGSRWLRIKGRIEQLAGRLTADRTAEAEGAAEARTGRPQSASEVKRARRKIKHRYGEDLPPDKSKR
jgi:hypothetical protein